MEDDASLHLVDARDGITLFVFLRIAAADEHHADGCTFVELDGSLVEVAFSHALEEIDDVAFESEHDALGLRVAHAAVVFYHHRFAIDVDESEEDEAFVDDAFLGESIDGGSDDAVFYLFHPFLCGERHWSDASHAACVESGIAFTDAFVVFSFGEDLIVFAVGEHEY